MQAGSSWRAAVASGDAYWMNARKFVGLTRASGRTSLLPLPGAMVSSGALALSLASTRAAFSCCL
jgi:hypothetical protein